MKPFNWRDGVVLVVAMLAPTFFTWLYFILLEGQGAVTRSMYLGAKGLLALLPVVWMWRRQCLVYRPTAIQNRMSIFWGIVFGLMTMISMFILYYGWLQNSSSVQGMIGPLLDKLKDAGVSSIRGFLLLGVFFCLVNSAFEEYYWRWFVFGRLRDGMNWCVAALISALAFTFHHILVLWIYVPREGKWWLLPLMSGAICFGGLIWAIIYHKSGSLLGGWIAHMMADVGIFWIGFSLCYGYLT